MFNCHWYELLHTQGPSPHGIWPLSSVEDENLKNDENQAPFIFRGTDNRWLMTLVNLEKVWENSSFFKAWRRFLHREVWKHQAIHLEKMKSKAFVWKKMHKWSLWEMKKIICFISYTIFISEPSEIPFLIHNQRSTLKIYGPDRCFYIIMN